MSFLDLIRKKTAEMDALDNARYPLMLRETRENLAEKMAASQRGKQSDAELTTELKVRHSSVFRHGFFGWKEHAHPELLEQRVCMEVADELRRVGFAAECETRLRWIDDPNEKQRVIVVKHSVPEQ